MGTSGPEKCIFLDDQDIVTLVVPGGASIEAQFDLVGVRASSLAGPGKRR
jgi:hypothetical protein